MAKKLYIIIGAGIAIRPSPGLYIIIGAGIAIRPPPGLKIRNIYIYIYIYNYWGGDSH